MDAQSIIEDDVMLREKVVEGLGEFRAVQGLQRASFSLNTSSVTSFKSFLRHLLLLILLLLYLLRCMRGLLGIAWCILERFLGNFE